MIHEGYEARIEKAKRAIQYTDTMVIGGGAGLSAAAGLDYNGRRFSENFGPFIARYGMKDLYSSSFYPFETQEEKWAYWAKHISLNRYETPATELYLRLYEFLKTTDHFVITTNVESQFEKAGFKGEKIFEVQGNYAFLQCETACHNKLYYNEPMVSAMMSETENCRIPGRLVPKCPVCGGEMDVNLRKDRYFVQDQHWYTAENRYNEFIKRALNSRVVFMELGVGFNTPGIIRFPFEAMLSAHPNAALIRLNRHDPVGMEENRDATIAFTEAMTKVVDDLLRC